MTRIVQMDAPMPADDMGWAREALTRGHAVTCARAFLGYGDGAGVPDWQLPQGLRVSGRVPDLFCLRSGLLVVSGTVRAMFEALDVGRHRFWPLTLIAGRAVHHTHHGLIVRATGAAIDEQASVCHTDPALPHLGLPRHVTLVAHRARVDPARLPDAHLWWDRALSKPYLMVSETLAPALEMLDAPPLRNCDG